MLTCSSPSGFSVDVVAVSLCLYIIVCMQKPSDSGVMNSRVLVTTLLSACRHCRKGRAETQMESRDVRY
jgi:hypothetical protein